MVIRCRNLMIPKIRCFFNVNAQFITAILIDNSGIWYSYLAGKVELVINGLFGFKMLLNSESNRLLSLIGLFFFQISNCA